MGFSRSGEALGGGEVPLVEGEGDVFEEFYIFVEDGGGVHGVDDGDAPAVFACSEND